MNIRQWKMFGRSLGAGRTAVSVSALAAAWCFLAASTARSSVTWDGEAGTHWWFNPVNWRHVQAGPTYTNNNDRLPPSDETIPTAAVTDTDISIGTGAWDQGFGVVFDPTNDPGVAAATLLTYPSGYGPLPSPSQPDTWRINQLYLSRAVNPPSATPVPANTLTLRGNLTAGGNVILGRSSGVTGVATNATIVLESGTFTTEQTLDLGANEQGINSRFGYGNGTFDYRGGNLQASTVGGGGLRLSAGGSGGPGGIGRFIVHNPPTPGHVRAFDVVVAGPQGTSSTFLADGVSTGVGVFEFHFENGGVRPIQVNRNMSINNGKVSATSAAIRSARLELVLHEAPCAGAGCVPASIGLFDVAFSTTGAALGTGDLDGDGTFDNDRVFSNSDNTKQYYPSSRWAAVKTSPNFMSMNWQDEDFLVTAQFGNTLYRWEASYSGLISWVAGQENDSVVQSVSGSGGNDVVLIGHSSVSLALPGDFNNDGKVNAADYVVWRKNPGNFNGPAGYADWRANFGNPPGAGAALAAAAVPEPNALAFGLMGMMGMAAVRLRQARRADAVEL